MPVTIPIGQSVIQPVIRPVMGFAGGSAFDPATGVYNMTSSNMAQWKSALEGAGSSYARLNCYGDSITAGSTTTPPPLGDNAWPTLVRGQLDAIYGAAGTGVVYWSLPDGDDTRVVKSGAWSGYTSFGPYGVYCTISSTPGDYITFGAVTCDEYIIHALGSVGVGPMGISVDGGSVTNYPYTATPNAPIAITVPAGSLGSHTIKMEIVTNWVFTQSVEATIGTTGVRTSRLARVGALADWLVEGSPGAGAGSTATGSLPFSFDLAPPDLSILMFGMNEFTTGATVASYKTAMQTIITKAKTFGDVLLVVTVPNSNTTATPSQQDYADALYELSDENNVPLIDFLYLWGTHADHPTWYSDALHPNSLGQQQLADAFFAAIHTKVLAL